jgi:hypothetical protein
VRGQDGKNDVTTLLICLPMIVEDQLVCLGHIETLAVVMKTALESASWRRSSSSLNLSVVPLGM